MASLHLSAVCQPLASCAGLEQTASSSMFSGVSSYFASALIIVCITLFLLSRLVLSSHWTPFSRGHFLARFSLTNPSLFFRGVVSIFFSLLGSWAIQACGGLSYSFKGTVTTILLGAGLFASYLGSRLSSLMFTHFSNKSPTMCSSPRSTISLTPSRGLLDPGNPNSAGVSRLVGKGISIATMGDEWDVQVPDRYAPVPYGLRMCLWGKTRNLLQLYLRGLVEMLTLVVVGTYTFVISLLKSTRTAVFLLIVMFIPAVHGRCRHCFGIVGDGCDSRAHMCPLSGLVECPWLFLEDVLQSRGWFVLSHGLTPLT